MKELKKLMSEEKITNIPLIINNFSHEDSRGVIFKNFTKKIAFIEVFENTITFSKANSIRGLHYQTKDPQDKIVTVINGKIIDYCLDIRPNSATYGKLFEFILDNPKKSLVVPKGFAHGYYSIVDSFVSLLYSSETNNTGTGYYIFDFVDYKNNIIISDKDKNLPNFKLLNNNF